MRKKLDTRFPAARIKKIMQADEDVGKIALAVPVLVSKALELFLQDLCNRTYEITLQRGAKTMNSVHLKHCVQSYNVFDFLRDVVSKVPDYGHGHGHANSDAASDDRVVSRRRKADGDDSNETDDEAKRSRMSETGHASGSRGRGKGRGRGRGRGARNMERETIHDEIESESGTTLLPSAKSTTDHAIIGDHKVETKKSTEETSTVANSSNHVAQPFDLNARSTENEGNSASNSTAATAATEEVPAEVKDELYPGWSISEVDKMAIDPLQLANLSNKIDEDNEDYDEEG